MTNHPNRAKTYPSYALADALRAKGVGVRLLWELPGPKGTLIAWLSCYQINSAICIVQTFSGDNGWNAFTPNDRNDVDATIADVMSRCGCGERLTA